MNYYEDDVSNVIREIFGKKDQFDKMKAFNHIRDLQRYSLSPENILMFNEVMHRSHSRFSDMPINQTVEILQSAIAQMTWELTTLSKGVTILVEDVALIEMMMRTEIDALMEDIKPPFPMCEFVFPEFIPLGVGNYQVSGSLLCDLSYDLNKEYNCKVVRDHDEGGKAIFQFMTRLKKMNGKRDVEGVSWLRFDPKDSLEELPKVCPTSQEDSVAVRKLTRLIFGLCLHLQTEEGQKSLIVRSPKKRSNVCPTIGRLIKKRKHVQIIDLITRTIGVSYKDESCSGHASPKTHWRRLHLRTLRHDRYKRNPDGSVKAIWVRPSLINAKSEDNKIESQKRRIRIKKETPEEIV